MSCPHSSAPGSSPLTCSQCLCASVKHVTVVQGVLTVDGNPLGNLADVNKRKFLQETADIGPPNKNKKCSNCGELGHNVRTCGVEVPDVVN